MAGNKETACTPDQLKQSQHQQDGADATDPSFDDACLNKSLQTTTMRGTKRMFTGHVKKSIHGNLDLDGRRISFRNFNHPHLPAITFAKHGFILEDENTISCVGCYATVGHDEVTDITTLIEHHKSASRVVDGEYVCHFIRNQNEFNELKNELQKLSATVDNEMKRKSQEQEASKAQYAQLVNQLRGFEQQLSDLCPEVKQEFKEVRERMEELEEKLFFCVKIEKKGVPPTEVPSTEGDATVSEAADDADCQDSDSTDY